MGASEILGEIVYQESTGRVGLKASYISEVSDTPLSTTYTYCNRLLGVGFIEKTGNGEFFLSDNFIKIVNKIAISRDVK